MEHDNYQTELERERAMEQVLLSQADPVTKVRQLKALGVDEEDAEATVALYQRGQMEPTYYERLEFEDEDEDDDYHYPL